MTALEHWSRRAQPEVLLSKSDEWRSPPALFAYASDRYGPYLLDAAAAHWNHLCSIYFSKQRNGLERPWFRRTWCNPPYSRGMKARFLRHGREQVLSRRIELVTYLLPHDTADSYWSDFIEAPAGKLIGVTKAWDNFGTIIQTRFDRLTVEIVQLKRRLRYQHADGSSSCRPGTARHSSALVTFARPGALKPLVPTSGLEAA